jgi:hypothetical protein
VHTAFSYELNLNNKKIVFDVGKLHILKMKSIACIKYFLEYRSSQNLPSEIL